MTKYVAVIFGIILITSIGCKEELVGAPCASETDQNIFSSKIAGTTWSIESRTVQCDTTKSNMVCLTKIEKNNNENSTECVNDASVESCWGEKDNYHPVQLKYSFCSCRCKNAAGKSVANDPDRYDYLCECPPDTVCESVLTDIEDAPEKIAGSYCVPNCIATPCETAGEVCTPSSDSEEPWKWKCKPL